MASNPLIHEVELEEENNLPLAQVRHDRPGCQWPSSNNQTIPDWWCPSYSLDPSNPGSNLNLFENFVQPPNSYGSTLWTYRAWNAPTLLPNYENFPVADLLLGDQAWTHSIPTVVGAPCGNDIGEIDFVVQDPLAAHSSQPLLQHQTPCLSGFSGSSDDAFNFQPEPPCDQNHITDSFTTVAPGTELNNIPWGSHYVSHLAEENIDRGAGTGRDSWGFYPTTCDLTRDHCAWITGVDSPLDPTEEYGPQSVSCAHTSESETRTSKREDSEPIAESRARGIVPTYKLGQQPTLLPDIREGLQIISPRGTLDQYIHALREVMSRLSGSRQLNPKLRQEMIATGVLWIVREAWPQAEHFWKLTASFRGFCQAETWRNFPEPTVYRSMHPSYRPTPTQLLVPHSPLIDWLPWPDLRDKIIASQDLLDVEFVCKTAIQNVVAHRRTDLRPRRRQQSCGDRTATTSTCTNKTSFRVWDLCILEEEAGSRPAESPALEYRPRSAPVKALVKAYGLEYDDFQTQKLHPDFFGIFPHIRADSAVSDYTVRDLPILTKSSEEDALGLPQKISQVSMERLEALERRLLQATS